MKATDIIKRDISLSEEALRDAKRHIAGVGHNAKYGSLVDALDAARDYAQAAEQVAQDYIEDQSRAE